MENKRGRKRGLEEKIGTMRKKAKMIRIECIGDSNAIRFHNFYKR